MIPLLLAALAAAGALGALLARGWPRVAALDAALALGLTAAVALLVPLGPPVALGEAFIRDSDALRAMVIVAAGALSALLVVAAYEAPESHTAVVAAATVVGIALVVGVSDASVALPAAAAAGFLGMAGNGGSWRGAFAQVSAVPAFVLAAVVLAEVLGEPIASTGSRAGETVGPVLLGGLLMVALVARLGTVPLHFMPLRLARGSSLSLVPVQVALLPALLAILVVAWMPMGPLAGAVAETPLGPIFVAVGSLTIILAVPAMLAQDDLGGLLTVHAISDLAVVVVALGAGTLTTGTAGVWLTLVVLARLGAAAVAVALASRTGSRSLRMSEGWMRIAPLSLAGWIVAIVGGLGWPGTLVYDTRIEILVNATPGVLAGVLVWASGATAFGYARLFLGGVRAPADRLRVRGGWGIRLRRWSSAMIAIALAGVPVAVALGGTRLASAMTGWQPFAPP